MSKGQKRDIHQEITDRIIEALEQGVTPWVMPWQTMGAPRNAGTQRPYSGINALVLGLSAMMNGYSTQEWVTFRQAKELGGNVRKGEKGHTVIFYRMIEAKDGDKAEGEEKRKIPLMRSFVVFNLDQIEGIEREQWTLPEGFGVEAAETIISGSGATIHHGGDRAFYAPFADGVTVPDRERFRSGSHYYGTLFHELVHWTGHRSRLARPGIIEPQPFGSTEYAFEELIAELGAAYLCAEAGIEGELRHEAYIASWIQALKDDKRFIFRAASQAKRAADYLAAPIRSEMSEAA